MIVNQYRLAWQFMKERVNKKWILFIVGYMLIFFIISLIVTNFSLESLLKFDDFLNGNEVDASVQDQAGKVTWYGLFLHNTQSDFVGILLGMVPFVPLIFVDIAINVVSWGILNGAVALMAHTSVLISFVYGMLPHCIFEVPANCLCDAMSFVLFMAMTKRVLKKSDEKLAPLFTNIIRVFILFVIPLLLIGGIVEAEVTPVTSAMLNIL